MMGIIARSFGLTIVLAAGALTLTAGDAAKPAKTGVPIITDWSSRHVVFSHPRTPEQAARIQNDVRYQMQLHRSDARAVVAEQVDEYISHFRHHPRQRRGRRMHRDWSWDLGPGASVGASNFPAKYSFSNNVATCVGSAQPDFVVFETGLAGSATQGSIIAVTNLYAGCSGQVPGNYWSYNTGGTINTSPVFSLDGTQLAFTQTNGTSSSLVLLKWSAFDGQVQNPATDLMTAIPSGYLACAAPCMTSFSLGANDTASPVFYDYSSDAAWVGDDSGKLHQYTGVFKGTPTEVIGGGWPASVSSNKLTGAVYDFSTGVTYVADTGGFVYSVSSAGAVTASARLDYATGFTESPILDSSAGSLYAFSSSDNTGSAGVFQMSTGFTSGSSGTEAKIGTASAGTTPQYDGAFDHDYIFSPTLTGNLYACGNPGGEPTLYQIPITNGAMGAVKTGPIISTTSATPCSPLTDVYNATETGAGLPQEWVFLSTQAAATPVGCGGHSCIMNFKNTQWQSGHVYNVGQEVLDSNLNIEVCENSLNTSGGTAPAWSSTLFGTTNDNGVHWRNQGPVQAFPPPTNWAANTTLNGGAEIIDSNNNIEIVFNFGTGTTGATEPTWPLTEGTLTPDGSIFWYSLGANPVAALPAQGGTSGIVIDNTTNLPGGSQVYFSNLQSTNCTTSGGIGGCAIQASQTVLH